MSTVSLSNGKKYDALWAGCPDAAGAYFAALFPDADIVSLAVDFSGQEQITVEEEGFEPRTYEGFTRISELRTMPDGISMILRKGE